MSDKSKPDALDEILRGRAKPTPPRQPRPREPQAKFTYALQAWTAERRASGWFVAATVSNGDKSQWTGPFESIETACLAIARRHATEIADRHTRSIEHHKIKKTDPLFGLKPTTKLT